MGARTSLVWCLLAMLALAGVAPAYSMHEDQAGAYDWHKSFLGEVTQAAFAGSKQNMRAFVSTEQGAIGAIEFKTGNLGARPDRRPSPRPRSAISPETLIRSLGPRWKNPAFEPRRRNSPRDRPRSPFRSPPHPLHRSLAPCPRGRRRRGPPAHRGQAAAHRLQRGQVPEVVVHARRIAALGAGHLHRRGTVRRRQG